MRKRPALPGEIPPLNAFVYAGSPFTLRQGTRAG